jgi:hypothetical protein
MRSRAARAFFQSERPAPTSPSSGARSKTSISQPAPLERDRSREAANPSPNNERLALHVAVLWRMTLFSRRAANYGSQAPRSWPELIIFEGSGAVVARL